MQTTNKKGDNSIDPTHLKHQIVKSFFTYYTTSKIDIARLVISQDEAHSLVRPFVTSLRLARSRDEANRLRRATIAECTFDALCDGMPVKEVQGIISDTKKIVDLID